MIPNPITSMELNGISVNCQPEMMNFKRGEERLERFSYRFLPGRTYGVVCEAGHGGWALSYLLSGLVTAFEGTVRINKKIVQPEELRFYGWYLGQALPASRNFFKKKMTIRRQLEYGTSKKYRVADLIERFELAPSRLDRELRHVSNERWNASAAIGLMHEKQVFCFPWLDEVWVEAIRVRLQTCSALLNEYGCITIIPIQNPTKIDHFIDEVLVIPQITPLEAKDADYCDADHAD
ncbi:hypothetical protein [Paenibacillus riograndensis]|uniref:hypothetical protein n=1 Tax=Paenibacillus riograndensis TaxID=483937 RepID=UPI000764B985|nr:hypothetical protein [Paenibacillus riograndensis]